MPKLGYSAQDVDPDKTAKAYGRELPISTKKSVELANAIRGRKVEDAKEYLERVIALRQPVPMKRYKKLIAHKRGRGPACYPTKVAKAFLKVVQSAQENAEYKGLDSENLRIKVVAAHKGMPTKSFRPRAYGRATKWFKETVNLELILEEVE